MANRIAVGLLAGAAGTLALNVTSYVDMLVRGRPASRLPAQVAGKIADEVGLPLDFDLEAALEATGAADDDHSPSARLAHRQEALGALLGMANGLGIGVAYATVRLIMPRPPTWLAGAVLGGAAMAASDYPASRLGLSDPKAWSGTDWLADVAPHMAFGLVTALAFETARK